MPPELVDALAGLVWASLWIAGGIWLARSAFRLRPHEYAVTGIGIGLVVENILANLLGRGLPLPLAFWVSALLVFLLGGLLALTAGWREHLRVPVSPWQAGILLFLTYLFTEIGRGLAIFDDYAHLPTTSLLAAGDIPPHFSLNPAVSYGYHYFLMLFAAQVVRIGHLAVWDALDFSRAFAFGLAILLAGLWTQRLTRSALAGLVGGLVMAFGSGARWLLLLLPGRLLHGMASGIHMLGSGAASGPDLVSALMSPWAVEGGGPLSFPYAFANGIYAPGVINLLGANSLIGPAVTLLLLLTYNRWRGWRGALVSVFLVAGLGLLAEVGLALVLAGWAVISVAYLFLRPQNWLLKGTPPNVPKRNTIPSLRQSGLAPWWGVLAVGTLVSLLEGGAWTDWLNGLLNRLSGGPAAASYQTVGFGLAWPPAIVSSHLGVLSILDPYQLLAGLVEIGPVLLVFPLLLVWGWKAYTLRRWFEAAVVVSAVLSLGTLLLRYTGSTGVRNTSRLYEFINVCAIFAVPLVWMWASHRSGRVKALAAGAGVVAVVGGMVMFGIELVAAQRPVYSYFITGLDKQMSDQYWNRLPAGTLVFDPLPSRAPTVFGRPTKSSYTWYQSLPEWEELVSEPTIAGLRAAGFDYVYLDERYWDELPQAKQASLQAACVQIIQEYQGASSQFRRLLDIRDCPADGEVDS